MRVVIANDLDYTKNRLSEWSSAWDKSVKAIPENKYARLVCYKQRSIVLGMMGD